MTAAKILVDKLAKGISCSRMTLSLCSRSEESLLQGKGEVVPVVLLSTTP